MLKLVLLSLALVAIPPAWSSNDSPPQFKYSLTKIYPNSHRQVDFLKKLAVSTQSSDYGGSAAIFLTPLGKGKTAYALLPSANFNELQSKFKREHIHHVFAEVANVKTIQVDNTFHVPEESPFSPSQMNEDGYIIESPRVTNWGYWGDWAHCSPGEFVTGMRLKTQHRQTKGDDTALNAIQLFCAAPGSHQNSPINSLGGHRGEFGQKFFCPNNASVAGFQLRSEEPQGQGDDTAANNLRIFCNGLLPHYMVEGDGLEFGGWSRKQACLANQAVCGFRTQLEPEVIQGDNTALNNVDMLCCNLPAEPKFCVRPPEKCALTPGFNCCSGFRCTAMNNGQCVPILPPPVVPCLPQGRQCSMASPGAPVCCPGLRCTDYQDGVCL